MSKWPEQFCLAVTVSLCIAFTVPLQASPPTTAIDQTWHYDPALKAMIVTIVNTSDKDITAYNLSVKVTLSNGVNEFQVTHDFLNVATLLDSVKGTRAEQELAEQVGPRSLPARGSYDEKIPVGGGFKNFEAVLDVVVFSDKTAEATNGPALQRLIASRKAKAMTIQKANETITAVLSDTTLESPHADASAKVQGICDAWKAKSPNDATVMNEGEFKIIIQDLKQAPLRRGNASEADYLKSYMVLKAKEQSTWIENAQLVLVGEKPYKPRRPS